MMSVRRTGMSTLARSLRNFEGSQHVCTADVNGKHSDDDIQREDNDCNRIMTRSKRARALQHASPSSLSFHPSPAINAFFANKKLSMHVHTLSQHYYSYLCCYTS